MRQRAGFTPTSQMGKLRLEVQELLLSLVSLLTIEPHVNAPMHASRPSAEPQLPLLPP